jgi:hypothetical protein
VNILGSTFGRALAGGGMAAADLANRYITADLQAQRDQAMADIQRNSAVQQAKELEEYNSSDEVQARRRAIADQNARAASKTGQDIKLDELSNSKLSEALRAKATADKKAEHDAVVAQTIDDANNPALLAAGTKIKLADPEVEARIAASRAQTNASNAHAGLVGVQTEGIKLDVADKKKLNGLYDQASQILSDPGLTDEERGKKYGDVQRQIVLIKSKNGQAPGRDPELDTETVVEKRIDANGNEITTTRKEVRRPGAAKPDAAPYQEGQEVRNKADGKIYVIRNGVPVLKDQPAAPAAAPATRSAPASTQPSNRTGDAVLNSMTADREQKLAGVAEQYRAVKAELQAAAGSGRQQEAVAAANKLRAIRNEYATLANSLFGNNADRYIQQLNAL